jgi:hypothetical protein
LAIGEKSRENRKGCNFLLFFHLCDVEEEKEEVVIIA